MIYLLTESNGEYIKSDVFYSEDEARLHLRAGFIRNLSDKQIAYMPKLAAEKSIDCSSCKTNRSVCRTLIKESVSFEINDGEKTTAYIDSNEAYVETSQCNSIIFKIIKIDAVPNPESVVSERLTRWNGNKWVLPQGRGTFRMIANRLAEYENTGLEPYEIIR